MEIKDINPILDTPTLLQLLQDRARSRKFAMSIGATDVHDDNYLFNDFNLYDTSDNTDKILNEIIISTAYGTFCAAYAT